MDGDQLVSIKRDNYLGPDLLSDLPLGIIHCILELIPIREVVRTCILSRQWRYIWATLPRLFFSGKDFCFEWKRMKIFITNVLFLHKGPIHKFRLGYRLAPEDGPFIDHLLLFLSRNEIRDLSLGIISSNLLFRLHSSLYSCQKLTHLELDNFMLQPPPPTFKGFSCLKSLVLRDVKVSSDIVESLVANSPLLEDFSYVYPSDTSELRISAPNLKFFDICGGFDEISLYAPLVAEVWVALDHEHENSGCNFTKFLGGCTNLEKLAGYYCFTKYLSIGIESYDHSLVFHHLKFILLDGMTFEDKDQLAVVGHLMMGAPNLEDLSIFWSEHLSESHHRTSFSDFGFGPNFTFNKLRSIRIGDLRGLPSEMEIIKYLLKSSPVLEKMDLYYCNGVESEVKSRLKAEYLSYYRASPNAEVLP